MNISSTDSTGWASSISSLQGGSGASRMRPPPPPDGDGGMGPQGPRPPQGGGPVGEALASALKSLGLDTSALTQSSTSEATDSSASDSSATSATSDVREDMRQFMHQLFSAMREAGSAGQAGDASGEAMTMDEVAPGGRPPPPPDFASDLSALVTQIGNGSAPSGLSSAFDKLMADLGGTSSSSRETGAGSSTTELTLAQLLTTMQQSFGYGGAGSTARLGNMLDATA